MGVIRWKDEDGREQSRVPRDAAEADAITGYLRECGIAFRREVASAKTFREVVAPRWSKLDLIVFEAACIAERERVGLKKALLELARRATVDVEYVAAGGRPWHTPGAYARDGVAIDLRHAEMDAATKNLFRLVDVALEVEPTEHAAIAWSVVNFFAGGR